MHCFASNGANSFIKLVKKFTEIEELTTEIVSTLIKKIIVSQAEKVDGVKRQKIKIIYNFIGDFEEEIAAS